MRLEPWPISRRHVISTVRHSILLMLMKTQMRFLFAVTILALTTTHLWSQGSPLVELTVSSTRLKCDSGFADVVYGYKRGTATPADLQLEFIFIQTSKHNGRFKSCFHLSSKVDDVTPPAYLAIGDGVIDLPNDNQLHVFGDGRHSQTDADITLAEIRDWLDQPDIRATIDSLLDHKTKLRAGKPQNGVVAASRTRAAHAEQQAKMETRWVQSNPKKVVWSSDGSANVLVDHSIELQGSRDWQEVTLYFQPPELAQIERVLLDVLPSLRSRVNGDRRLVLFDVKPHLESIENGTTRLEFHRCRFLGNESDETAANCIDFLSDTGWMVPDFAGQDASHQLVLELRKPVTVRRDSMFAITIDAGGAPDLKQLSRIRVSFSGRLQDGG